jgi:CxxC-x17-CxxC domain-containing protein
MEFQDKVITCEDCGKEFTHSAEDQQKYAERGFASEPKRCRDCRQARKERAASGPRGGGGGGGGYGGGRGGQGGGGRGGYGGGGRRGGGGGFERRPRPTFEAICAACGVATTLPFEPTQGRDVYCRDCYQKMKGGGR